MCPTRSRTPRTGPSHGWPCLRGLSPRHTPTGRDGRPHRSPSSWRLVRRRPAPHRRLRPTPGTTVRHAARGTRQRAAPADHSGPGEDVRRAGPAQRADRTRLLEPAREHRPSGTGTNPSCPGPPSGGYALDVVFDTALDDEPELLGRYGTLVTAGHDEHWTAECRERTEEFVAGGGNVLVFAGNTCWWRTEVRDSELRVAKDGANPVVGDLWWRTDRPEASLIGLSFRHGGASWLAGRPPRSYEFRPDGDALLDGVDLAAFAELTDLAGYEVDGHAYEPGRPWQPAGVEDVPDGLVVLAYAPLADEPPAHWYSDPREPHLQSPRCATIAYHRHGDALIFNGVTTDWPRHLDHPAVDRLTRNVLDAAGVHGV
ncbi:N,N-dimethylformamidase beta subunit family domain-containing protein [Streptomyces mirabilis]|uniref:N,N-dimethylformamidase beta subunit family domain-containing protein n=1 Tax=Streptomyces mirabilis TaxID=68239 RepID=UPI003680A608